MSFLLALPCRFCSHCHVVSARIAMSFLLELPCRFCSHCHVVSARIAMSFLLGMDGANEPRHLDRSPSELLERDGLRLQEPIARATRSARERIERGCLHARKPVSRADLGVQFARGSWADGGFSTAFGSQAPDKLPVSPFFMKLNNSPILVKHSIIRYGPGIVQCLSEI
jgi:hypothetical protein